MRWPNLTAARRMRDIRPGGRIRVLPMGRYHRPGTFRVSAMSPTPGRSDDGLTGAGSALQPCCTQRRDRASSRLGSRCMADGVFERMNRTKPLRRRCVAGLHRPGTASCRTTRHGWPGTSISEGSRRWTACSRATPSSLIALEQTAIGSTAPCRTSTNTGCRPTALRSSESADAILPYRRT